MRHAWAILAILISQLVVFIARWMKRLCREVGLWSVYNEVQGLKVRSDDKKYVVARLIGGTNNQFSDYNRTGTGKLLLGLCGFSTRAYRIEKAKLLLSSTPEPCEYTNLLSNFLKAWSGIERCDIRQWIEGEVTVKLNQTISSIEHIQKQRPSHYPFTIGMRFSAKINPGVHILRNFKADERGLCLS